VPPLKHADGRCLNRLPQHLVQTMPCHNVGLTAKDAGGVLLHVHQFEQAELSLFVVKKQVDVGIVLGLATRGRAEHVEMFNAKPLQVGFVVPQSADGFVALRISTAAQIVPRADKSAYRPPSTELGAA
jgi:hypothetical protein